MVDAILGFQKTYCVLGHIEADHGIRRLEGHKGNNREPVSQISFQQPLEIAKQAKNSSEVVVQP